MGTYGDHHQCGDGDQDARSAADEGTAAGTDHEDHARLRDQRLDQPARTQRRRVLAGVEDVDYPGEGGEFDADDRLVGPSLTRTSP